MRNLVHTLALLLALAGPADAGIYFKTWYDGVAIPCNTGGLVGVGRDWGWEDTPDGTPIWATQFVLDTPPNVVIGGAFMTGYGPGGLVDFGNVYDQGEYPSALNGWRYGFPRNKDPKFWWYGNVTFREAPVPPPGVPAPGLFGWCTGDPGSFIGVSVYMWYLAP